MRQIQNNGSQPLRHCTACGEDLPLYRFKNRGKGEGTVCLTCENQRAGSRASIRYNSTPKYEFRHYEPPLSADLKEALDDYVKHMIDAGSYASLNANHRLLRNLGEEKATDALFVYADCAREWCVVTHGKGNGRHYHFMGYREEDDENQPEYRYIDPSDFKLIDRYIGKRMKPLIVNTGVVDHAGISLNTPEQKRWLLLRSYFGLRPQHKILWRGAVECRAFWDRKFDTYLVGEPKDAVPPDAEGYSIAVKLFEQYVRGSTA